MKKALVVVDFQKDFIDGSLGFEKAQSIRSVIVKKIENAVSDGTDLIFTLDTHGENYLESFEGRNLPVSHCIKGTDGWKLDSSVACFADKAKKIIEKPTFGSLELGNFLAAEKYDEVELCGLVTSICVISNAVMAKAALPEAAVIVDSTATEDGDQNCRETAFNALRRVMVTVR